MASDFREPSHIEERNMIHDSYGPSDADLEQADLERAGIRGSMERRRVRAAMAAGDLMMAARLCSHGWQYPLDSIAAREASDPRAGQRGVRCLDCGSAITVDAITYRATSIIAPCEIRGEVRP